jgi:hypothetical protein
MENQNTLQKSGLEKLKLFGEVTSALSAIISFIAIILKPFAWFLEFPYLPTYVLIILACFIGIFVFVYRKRLSQNRIGLHYLILALIPILIITIIVEFPEKPPIQKVFNFWKPFVGREGCKIVIGTPLVWTGPHDPIVPIKTEPVDVPEQRIVINDGWRYYSLNDFSKLPKNSYMLPRMSFNSSFDFETAYQVKEFLLPKFRSEIIQSQSLNSFDNNLILIGGPLANSIVAYFLDKLEREHSLKFGFKFLIRKGNMHGVGEGPLIHIVDSTSVVGIGDARNNYHPLVEFKLEQKSPPKPPPISIPGEDGAIIIKSFNPDFPDKSILVIAGYEEQGTFAGIDILRKLTPELEEIDKLYEDERAAVEFVVKTSVIDKNPTSPKIIKFLPVEKN